MSMVCLLALSVLSIVTPCVAFDPTHSYGISVGALVDESGTIDVQSITEVALVVAVAQQWSEAPAFFTWFNVTGNTTTPIDVSVSWIPRDTLCAPVTAFYQAAALAVPLFEIIAFIGPPCDSAAQAANAVAASFDLPQLTYGATGDELTLQQFPWLLRTIGDNDGAAGAVISYMLNNSWDHFTVISSQSEFGTQVAYDLQQQAEYWNIDLMSTVQFNSPMTNWSWVLDGVGAVHDAGCHVFVVASAELACQELLLQLYQRGQFHAADVWIMADATCIDLNLNGSFPEIATLLPGIVYVNTSFDATTAAYAAFVVDYLNLTLNGTVTSTSDIDIAAANIPYLDMLLFDSIMAVYEAARLMFYLGIQPTHTAGAELMQVLIHNVSFQGVTGNVSFSAIDGSRIGVRYAVTQFDAVRSPVLLASTTLTTQQTTYYGGVVPCFDFELNASASPYWPGWNGTGPPPSFTPPTSAAVTTSGVVNLSSEALVIIICIIAVFVVIACFSTLVFCIWRRGTATMIAEIRQAASTAQHAHLREKEANRVKSDFLTTMTHEIRTPMNGVCGMTDLLTGTKLSTEQAELVSTLMVATTQMRNVINDVLDFHKLEDEKVELDVDPCVLCDVVDEAIQMSWSGHNKTSSDLILFFDPHLPHYVLADATRIRQIISNLLSNAIKFGGDRGIIVRVERGDQDSHLFDVSSDSEQTGFVVNPKRQFQYRIRPWTDDERVEMSVDHKSREASILTASRPPGTEQLSVLISVEDNGIGIPRERMARLFKPFSQTDSSISRQYGGTGLGLVICAKLTRLMQGKIWCHTRAGRGSRFSCTINVHAQTTPVSVATLDVSRLDTVSGVLPYSPSSQMSASVAAELEMAAVATPKLTSSFPYDAGTIDACIVCQDMVMLRVVCSMLYPSCRHVGGFSTCSQLYRSTRRFDLIIVDCDDNDGDRARCLTTMSQASHVVLLVTSSPTGEGETGAVVVRKPLRRKDLLTALGEASRPRVTVHSTDDVVAIAIHEEKEQELAAAPQLPSGTSAPLLQAAPQTGRRVSSAPARVDALHILCVEDNAVNQKVFAKMIERLGYATDLAENGLVALDKIRANQATPYDVIFMDIQMPLLDGLSCTAVIAEAYGKSVAAAVSEVDAQVTLQAPPDTYRPLFPEGSSLPRRPKIIAVTANATDHYQRLCIACGMDDYLSKPLVKDDLQKVLKRTASAIVVSAV